MKTIYSRQILLSVLLLGVTAMLFTACGGPRVESTSIDGSVRQIDNWEIEWTGDSTVTVDSTTLRWLTEKRSKYSQPEFCLEYIANVRQELISSHDLPFYDNSPPSGILEVSIDGIVRTVTTPSPEMQTEKQTAEIMKDRGSQLVDPFDREKLYSHNVDQVKRVRVRMFDRNNKLLGEIFVGGEEDSKVKPHDVATAIAHAIKEGRVPPPRTPK